MPATPSVRFDHQSILIHNTPTIVLCGSLFYFRIPRALWQERLNKIKAAGYNCIDVYIPWNYHELVEGGWDFSGERDVETFFQMAVDTGLWIVARPGPYICSEWDGGALPAYLPTHPPIRFRDNDPVYLRYVARWFDCIFPILEKFQVTAQGGIILIQLENELDFFDCDDRTGYMSALRDMARKYDLRVPLIACAGQGDIAGATGHVPGIIPTGNFYPDQNDPGIEAKVSFYRQELATQEIPLMVTETNWSHFHLRRLLSCGVKLLGPYNQVAGNNFGFTNAVNNWGDPLAFLATEYDFDSMVSWTGELREEFFEARLLSGFINAFGESLAAATPLDTQSISVEGDFSIPDDGPYGLQFANGGSVLALPNFSDTTKTVTIQTPEITFPKYSSFTIPRGYCPYVVQNISLQQWNCEGTLVYATAEIAWILIESSHTMLVLYTDSTGEMTLSLPDDVEIETNGMTMHVDNTQLTCCFTPERISTARIRFQDGRQLVVFGMDRTRASHVERITLDGDIVWNAYASSAHVQHTAEVPPAIRWMSASASESGGAVYRSKIVCNAVAKHLEEVGILRGYGWYGAQILLENERNIEGFLLHDGADVLSLYVNGLYHGTVVPGGGTAYLDAMTPNSGPSLDVLVRAEIWGHSNFDDVRLPAMRLGSMRGLRGITAITRRRDISTNWRFLPIAPEREQDNPVNACFEQDFAQWIILDWAAWMTARHPHNACFRKRLTASKQVNSWNLHFPGIQFRAHVYVNGHDFGEVNPHNPYVNISPQVRAGETFEVAILTEQAYGDTGGTVLLLEGITAKDWWIGGGYEADFVAAARDAYAHGRPLSLPCRFAAGEVRWFLGKLPDVKACHMLSFTGKNIKITAVFNDRLVGRLWLPSGDVRPAMKGGMADNRVYLPGPWFRDGDNRLALYAEAVVLGADAEITNMTLKKVA